MKPNLKWTIRVEITFRTDPNDPGRDDYLDHTFASNKKYATCIDQEKYQDCDIINFIDGKMHHVIKGKVKKYGENYLNEGSFLIKNPEIYTNIISAELKDNTGVWKSFISDESLSEYNVI